MGESLASTIRAALSGLSGRLPRRAAVWDGVVVDRARQPQAQEVAALSVVCEAVRLACKDPVYSRQTPVLLRQCLEENLPDAWRCLLDDEATADLDHAALAYALGEPTAPLRLVQCFVGASTGLHMWLVVKAANLFRAHMTPAAVADMATSFQRAFPDLVATLSCRFNDVTQDMRAAAITSLGALMVWTGIPTATLATMLEACADSGKDDVMRLFLTAPVVEIAQHAPCLVDKLLRRAEKTHQSSRYPPCALLASLTPDQLRPHAPRVMKLVRRSLDVAAAQGDMDLKLALVCGVMAKSVCAPRSLEASLAHALSCSTYSQLQGQVT